MLNKNSNVLIFAQRVLLNPPFYSIVTPPIRNNYISQKLFYHLYFLRENSVVRNSAFGNSPLRSWISNLRCNGNESDIRQCASDTWGRNNCSWHDNVGISCRKFVQLHRNFDSPGKCYQRIIMI